MQAALTASASRTSVLMVTMWLKSAPDLSQVVATIRVLRLFGQRHAGNVPFHPRNDIEKTAIRPPGDAGDPIRLLKALLRDNENPAYSRVERSDGTPSPPSIQRLPSTASLSGFRRGTSVFRIPICVAEDLARKSLVPDLAFDDVSPGECVIRA